MHWNVIEVEPAGPLTLHVRFADGLTGHVRFAAYSLHGVFEALRDPGFFARAYIDAGAVTWPNGADLAPDAMHAEIAARGEWAPTV